MHAADLDPRRILVAALAALAVALAAAAAFPQAIENVSLGVRGTDAETTTTPTTAAPASAWQATELTQPARTAAD
jgi:hypothetical protein